MQTRKNLTMVQKYNVIGLVIPNLVQQPIKIGNPPVSKVNRVIRPEVKAYLHENFTFDRVVADEEYSKWFDEVFEAQCQCDYIDFKHRLDRFFFAYGAKEVEQALGFSLSERETMYIDSFLHDLIDSFVREETKACHGNIIEIQERYYKEKEQAKAELEQLKREGNLAKNRLENVMNTTNDELEKVVCECLLPQSGTDSKLVSWFNQYHDSIHKWGLDDIISHLEWVTKEEIMRIGNFNKTFIAAEKLDEIITLLENKLFPRF